MADSDGANMPTGPRPEPTETRTRKSSVASRFSYKARSVTKDFEESNPPSGFMAATSHFASSAVVGDISRRNSDNSGNSLGQQLPRRRTLTEQATEPVPRESAEFQGVSRDAPLESRAQDGQSSAAVASDAAERKEAEITATLAEDKSHRAATATEPFENGYHFPPSYPKGEAFKHGLMSFLHYSITPIGFCVVLYGLNVVAWGGMLFLLLCNASPAMCYPSCNDINSPRRVWIEYDSQVLTALFSLTAFGLAPWRFRDLYYLIKYRLGHQQDALRRLAGIHRDWFRLPESSGLPVNVGPENVETFLSRTEIPLAAVPEPANKIPEAPLTGERAPATKAWKMDFVIWMMIWNTLFQCVLSGVMWGMNRFDRPSWSTGLFVALGCIVAAVGGIMMFIEGRHVKAIEGVPLTDRDRERLARDRQVGVPHYNNLQDKPPSKEKADSKKGSKDVESGLETVH